MEKIIAYRSGWPNRVRDKRVAAIKLGLKFGITTSHHIGLFLGLGRAATYKTVADLKEAGILQVVYAPSVPCEVFSLTKAGFELGAEIAREWVNDPDVLDSRPSYRPQALSHDLLAQYVLLLWYLKHIDDETFILSEPELRSWLGSSRARNIPDGMIRFENCGRTEFWALEVQESVESLDAIERRLSHYGDQFHRDDIRKLKIASTHAHILESYRRVLMRGVKPWDYDPRRKEHYRVKDGCSLIPPEMIEDRFEFDLITEWRGLFSYR